MATRPTTADPKFLVRVRLVGCDDTTEFEMLVTQPQRDMLEAMVTASKMASSYSCMPTMAIENIMEAANDPR